MNAQFRLLVLVLGALFVAATFTYPAWRVPPEGAVQSDELPQLLPELQDDFLTLPRPIQTSYRRLSEQNVFQAATMVEARLTAPEPLVQPLPEIGNATLFATGTFGPVIVSPDDTRPLPPLVAVTLDDDDPRDPPPLSNLHPSSGEVQVYRYPDDRVLLRIENLNVVNGPELTVALATEANPLTVEDFGRQYVPVGPLPANTGNMNLEIVLPDLPIYQSIVIYDRRYEVVFSVAPLR